MDLNTHTVENKVITEGWLHKVGKWNSDWKRRYFILDKVKRHLLYYAKTPHSNNAINSKKHIKPKGYIDLLSVELQPSSTKMFTSACANDTLHMHDPVTK